MLDIQSIAASLIVLAAGLWLGRRIFGVFRAASGKIPISGCDACPKNRDPSQIIQVTEIDGQSDSLITTRSQTQSPDSE